MAVISRLPGPLHQRWDWQLQGACRRSDARLFFHPSGERGRAHDEREEAAKRICGDCPVRAECLAHALSVREPYGVWGGMGEDERRAVMGPARRRAYPAAGTGRGAGRR
ncbi:WhiB family transcriptional regulator [Kitasatospora sp. DSM 101779]|uniref:WhiB family transcriptional regulator n=1 Tax=Kitasatospora sp. DSM 101779 TaxID=2853165 RepID=UPI0021DAC4A1|nr:WhiB family transcriptional regulator [Kitasatospora sp. DSM 101779]MCU7826926.1 WhiB family transcriptional regulator [Kitasatospora sp. DSM 101779]